MLDQISAYLSPFYITIFILLGIFLVQIRLKINYAHSWKSIGGVSAPSLASNAITGIPSPLLIQTSPHL